jgi:hypothetical protein
VKVFRLVDEDGGDNPYGQRRLVALGLSVHWPFPIAGGLSGSGARILGYKIYGGAPPWLVKRWLFPFFRRLKDAKLWVMYRVVPRHQYHLIRTGLPPGYYDADTLMLHGAMAMLCRYVEDECGGVDELGRFTRDLRDPGKQDKNAPDGLEEAQADRQTEAVTIYLWWKRQRPADHERHRTLLHSLYGRREIPAEFNGDGSAARKALRAMEAKMHDDDQSMLHRLIDIRCSLWT